MQLQLAKTSPSPFNNAAPALFPFFENTFNSCNKFLALPSPLHLHSTNEAETALPRNCKLCSVMWLGAHFWQNFQPINLQNSLRYSQVFQYDPMERPHNSYNDGLYENPETNMGECTLYNSPANDPKTTSTRIL